MPAAAPTRTQQETRERLLEAAGETFAEKGFRLATVREICKRAAANVAAVNYHFGDKEGLYMVVLRETYQRALEKYPPDLGLNKDSSPEERLHAFVHSLLLRIFDKGRRAWHGKLISREIMEPTAALKSLAEKQIRPLEVMLESIVRELLGRGATAKEVRLAALSIVGQCLFYHHSRPVIERLFPGQRYDAEDIVGIADHITRFSLAALLHSRERVAAPRKARAKGASL